MTTTLSVRQQEIIEAAGKILTVSGVSGLTIKNLAREMKFSESAIYRHFASKAEIILTLLDYLAENMTQRFSILDKSEMPDEKLTSLFQSQSNFFSSHPYFVVAVFSDGFMEESDEINRAVLNIMNVKMSHVTPIITEGQQSGIFTDTISSDRLIHILMSSFRLLMFKWRIAQFSFDLVEESNQLIESLLILIKRK